MVESLNTIKKLARQCRFGSCTTRATFCYPQTPKEVYCKVHKQDNMISIQANTCKKEGCQKQGTFKDEEKNNWCLEHKPDTIIKSRNDLCKSQNCDKRATYGKILEGGLKSKAVMCKDHKESGMIDIMNPICKKEGCSKRKYKSDPSGMCFEHINEPSLEQQIKELLINSIMKQFEEKYITPPKNKKWCAFDKCEVRGTFGLPNQQKPKIRYCSEHKGDQMIDLTHKKCEYEDCQNRAYYNYVDENKGIYCIDHKLPQMIIIHTQYCQFAQCSIKASFGLESDRKRLYCNAHKQDGMIQLDGSKCQQNQCKIRPYFNIVGQKLPLYCNRHKMSNMINIYSVQCKKCEISARYDGLCSKCYYLEFPNNTQTRQFKIKEKSVVTFLRQNGFEDLINDKLIQDGQSKYRPDILIQRSTHNIICEIDEVQHKVYNKEQEDLRIKQLYLDLKEQPLVIIRFNPDGYYLGDQRVRSPWTYIDRNNLVLNNQQDWDNRLQQLLYVVSKMSNNIPENQIHEVLLFMDQQ